MFSYCIYYCLCRRRRRPRCLKSLKFPVKRQQIILITLFVKSFLLLHENRFLFRRIMNPYIASLSVKNAGIAFTSNRIGYYLNIHETLAQLFLCAGYCNQREL